MGMTRDGIGRGPSLMDIPCNRSDRKSNGKNENIPYGLMTHKTVGWGANV